MKQGTQAIQQSPYGQRHRPQPAGSPEVTARASRSRRIEKKLDAAAVDGSWRDKQSKEKNHKGLLNFTNVKRCKDDFHRKMKLSFLHFGKMTLVGVWERDQRKVVLGPQRPVWGCNNQAIVT